MSDGYVMPCGAMAGDCSAMGIGCDGCGNNREQGLLEMAADLDHERRKQTRIDAREAHE
jgi:hypothetical protein